MHLTVGMKVWRNQYYIVPVLTSIYTLADHIVIAYGPVKPMAVWKPDKTLELIKTFPDPEKKITLLEKPFWDNITQMVNATYQLTKELYMKLDGDEIISPELVEEIKQNLNFCTKKNKPIIIGNIHFLRSFKQHVIKSAIDPWRLRIFLAGVGYQFRHPDFVPGVFNDPNDPGKRLKNPIYHYAYVRPVTPMIIKLTYHWLHWKKYKLQQALETAKDRLIKLRDNTYSWKIHDWQGKHPLIVRDHKFSKVKLPWIINEEELKKELA